MLSYRHKQAKAFATQYGGNTQVKGSVFDQLRGTTSGGALGGDVTGKPMWGNPVSADRASSTTGLRVLFGSSLRGTGERGEKIGAECWSLAIAVRGDCAHYTRSIVCTRHGIVLHC